MDSSGFDPSVIVAIFLALAFVVLVVLAIVRMTRKGKGGSHKGTTRRPAIDEDEDDEEELRSARGAGARRDARSGQPAHGDAGRQGPVEPVAAAKGPAKQPVVAEEPSRVREFKADVVKARHMAEGLSRTRHEGFVARLAETFRSGTVVDETLIAGAEESLLTADIGVKTALELTEGLRSDFKPGSGDLVSQVMGYLRERTCSMLAGQAHGLPALDAPGLNVVMVVGVNGTGKTTNIAKLANHYASQGRKVLLAAGDTYRAAGADQLGIWGERIGIPVVVGKPGQDPSALFFDAARRAVNEGFDILIADTAGRLHTDTNLVDELKKVHRVFGKSVPGAPHEVLLMLDATMGQNAVRQADVFLKSVKVTGIGLSKLDGTARGGVVVSIARDMNLPIWFVGVGEAVTDIRSFDPREFVDALYAVD